MRDLNHLLDCVPRRRAHLFIRLTDGLFSLFIFVVVCLGGWAVVGMVARICFEAARTGGRLLG